MTATVAVIAERALRRLGVAIVPIADRPTLTEEIPQATIAANALIELGVIAGDETPAPADLNLAIDKVRAVQASLAAQGMVWWSDAGVPFAVSEEYTKLAACMMATSFGKLADPQALALLENRIRRVVLVLSAPDVAQEAVMDVHRDLAGRGLSRWTIWDIPDALTGPLAVLAADALSVHFPTFAKPDPRETLAAQRGILRYVSLPTSGETIRVEYF